MEIWRRVRGGLIVSCQAREGNPMAEPSIIAALAYNAQLGGAVGIRVASPVHTKAVKELIQLPVFDCHKAVYPDSDVYITPTSAEATASARAGADVIAVDATDRPRPGGLTLSQLIRYIKNELRVPIMADISTYDEGLKAADLGVDAVSTTLSGYTPYSPKMEGPDLKLVARLASALTIPVIAEGRVRTPEEARLALEMGAWAVVVGGAITMPEAITRRFVQTMHATHSGS